MAISAKTMTEEEEYCTGPQYIFILIPLVYGRAHGIYPIKIPMALADKSFTDAALVIFVVNVLC
jgi:hypothetical protein